MLKIDKLKTLKNTIENMSFQNQCEILDIFLKHNVKYSENNNGTFILLNNIETNLIEKLENYITYVKEQTSILNEIETKKDDFKKNYFNKDIKEKA